MVKLLFMVAIGFVIYFILKTYLRSLEAKRGARDGEPAQVKGGVMVRCAQCGVHLPRSEALLSKQQFFCNDEHRALFFK